MIISAKDKEIGIYEQEFKNTLQKLKEEAPPFEDMGYFIKTVHDYFSFEKIKCRRPKVIVLGTSIPEELVYASGATPYWILGGSLGATAWADDAVPRDTDPVSRSMLGYLADDLGELSKDSLIVIPAVNDSCRKLAYLLKREGKKVHTVDIPPIKDELAAAKWERQIERCADALSAHTGRRITGRALKRTSNTVAHSKMLMRQFIQLSQDKTEILTGAHRMFILYSYYCSENIEEWNAHLTGLNALLKRSGGQKGNGGKHDVLLMGSPVYFPNYKIPFLLQDVGLNIRANVDYTTQKIFSAVKTPKEHFNIAQWAHTFYRKDCSSAYTKNHSLFQHVSSLVIDKPIDGVVYHVLKGQIEYDFELERFEEFFSCRDIPVFRLETDYKYQDIEQLRIRMDAFLEMLSQRRYRREGCMV